MSNSTMNQIKITNPIIYRLDFNNYMLSINIITDTKSNALIDLSKNSVNETKIISSNNIYDKFKKNNLYYSNKNIGAVKFYSYAGGKEISRLVTGITQMSNLVYPPFNGTLFSSIIMPEINNNDNIYLLIDSYEELNTISCPKIKKDLINTDLILMLKNIKNIIENKKVNFIILFEIKIYEELIKYEPMLYEIIISQYDIKLEKSTENIVSYLSDLVFGKVLGGQTIQFTGVINPENFNIIDAFIINNPTQSYTLINKISGLSVLGNGTATINMILRSNCNDIILTEIRLIEVTTRTELINISLNKNIKVHKNTNEILKFIKLYDYSFLVKNIMLTNNRNKIKQFMKDNLEKNYNYEFNFLDSYNSKNLEEDIKMNIDHNIIIYYNNLINNLLTIRNMYYIKRSLNETYNNNITNANFINTQVSKPCLKRTTNNIDQKYNLVNYLVWIIICYKYVKIYNYNTIE